MNKIKIGVIVFLMMLVSWNSLLAQGSTSLDIKAFKDYNGNNQKNVFEPFVDSHDNFLVLQERMQRRADGNCPLYTYELTEKIFQNLDNDRQTTLQIRTDYCYWFTMYDKDFQQVMQTRQRDIFVNRPNANPRIFVIEAPFDVDRIFLPLIN
jgi:hypothetical protein